MRIARKASTIITLITTIFFDDARSLSFSMFDTFAYTAECVNDEAQYPCANKPLVGRRRETGAPDPGTRWLARKLGAQLAAVILSARHLAFRERAFSTPERLITFNARFERLRERNESASLEQLVELF